MSAREIDRMAGLTQGPRRDFLASRWLIRQALAAASGHQASQCQPVDGRPELSAWPPGWCLSVSHSGGLAGCAVAAGTPLGLDIEPLTRRPHWQKVVNRWFSSQEQAWLIPDDDAEAFLTVWTLKEAWLKATGRGIANNLRTLCVSRDFGLSGDQSGQNWQASVGGVAGYLITVVYQGENRPSGFMIPGAVNLANVGSDIADPEPIRWLFHRIIHPITKPA